MRPGRRADRLSSVACRPAAARGPAFFRRRGSRPCRTAIRNPNWHGLHDRARPRSAECAPRPLQPWLCSSYALVPFPVSITQSGARYLCLTQICNGEKRYSPSLREQKNSLPRPVAHGTSHDEADLPEPDVADVVRANLLRLMTSRGLSLQGLAELAGVSPAALKDLAEGRSFPALGLLLKLARALDLPCTVFIEEPVTVRPVAPHGAWRLA